jgi:hypothetical protein
MPSHSESALPAAASDATRVIDFVAVLLGYAISGERTLEAFYQAVHPWEEPFRALFDREKLPSRSALSRDLSSVSWEAREALRTLFLNDLLACSSSHRATHWPAG